MARWITATEEPAIAPAPPAETRVRVVEIGDRLAEARAQIAALESRPTIVPDAPATQTSVTRSALPPRAKRPSTKKSVSPATSTLTGFPDVVPVPGAEEMYAAWCARGAKSRRGKKSAMKYQYPAGDRYGKGAWPAPTPGSLVAVPTGPDERDQAWRKKNAKLDGYLSHLEVAGRILRRYAIDADTQHLELPESPGSLTVGETLEWSAERIAANLEHLVVGCIGQEVAGAHAA